MAGLQARENASGHIPSPNASHSDGRPPTSLHRMMLGLEDRATSIDKDDSILDWDGPTDPGNPYNWSSQRKWLVTCAALLGTFVVPLNGTSITIAAEAISKEFHVHDYSNIMNSYWLVTSWSMGGALFIITGLPLMEDIGVRIGYISLYMFFILMIIPQALAPNFATLLVTRFFSGGCVALLANTVASVIPDIWAGDKARTLPVGVYILLYLTGSSLGPPLFAGIIQHVGNWRWIFYIQIIIYCACFPVFCLLLKETRGTVILRRRAKHIRRTMGGAVYTYAELDVSPLHRRLLKSMIRPAHLLFTEPVLFASTIWSAFSFGTVFLFTQSVTQVFSTLYGWEEYSTGYVQGAVVIGEIFGWLATLYSSHLYLKSAARNTEAPGRPIPEARLYVSAFASFFGIVGGMLFYAFTSYPSFPWIAPAIGLALVGFGIQVVVSAVADYITDAYAASNYAGSAISAVAAVENMVAGFLPLSAQSMYTNLGFQWASILLGLLAFVLSFAPVLFIWKGRQFRTQSPFMQAGRELGRGGQQGE